MAFPLAITLAVPFAAPSPRAEDDLLLFLGELYHRRQKARPELRQITLEITRRCELACRHCYMRATRRPARRELSFREICGLGLSVRQDFGRNVGIAITGGEPTLRKDLPLILRYLRTLGLPVSLVTNGHRIDRRRIRKLEEHLSGIAISLDGREDAHDWLRGAGTWRRALRAVRLSAASAIPHVVVKTAVYRNNFADLPDLLGLVRRLGVDEWHVFPAEPWGRATRMRGALLGPDESGALCDWFDSVKGTRDVHVCFEEQNSFLRKRPARDAGKFKRCLAGIRSLAVLANGDVVACVQASRNPEGNVRRERLADIWKRGFAACRSRGFRTCRRHLE